MKRFLIIIGAIFAPMYAATQAGQIFARLPDITILVFLILFLIVLSGIIVFNIERN